ncbi:hypothetical protein C8R45DRAFT_83033 [Mycena sanguinolenta]|nr:hypothetical protein C8R45DRAFT_83033 [Mycena sanguinolenta]
MYDLHSIQRLLDALAPCIQRLSFQEYIAPAELNGSLDLHKLVHLHTLSLHINSIYLDGRLSLDNLLLPPQLLALVIDIVTAEDRPASVQHLADADRALAALSLKSLTIVFSAWSSKNGTYEKVIDVSHEFLPKTPLLANKLGGALCILEKKRTDPRLRRLAGARCGVRESVPGLPRTITSCYFFPPISFANILSPRNRHCLKRVEFTFEFKSTWGGPIGYPIVDGAA